MVAMSGGVDSSVAALLLKESGYEVIGAHMRLWFREEDEQLYEENVKGCCSLAAAHDAQRVADKIGIPYYVLNLRESFYRKVVTGFIGEYIQGRTPNPCIACNRFIKWQEFLKKAEELDCDYIATGHYARIEYDDGRDRYLLYRGKDKSKDQTYMLSQITQKQLSKTLFPLGGYNKESVRRIALEHKLGVGDKPDSQEICFVPEDDYGAFLQGEVPDKVQSGPIMTLDGERVGEHKGIAYYTIGQRRGLGVALGRPMYVVDIDPQRNALIIGEEDDLYARGLIAEDINFIPFETFEQPLDVSCKIRYNADDTLATLHPLQEKDCGKVLFETPQKAVTPGQGVTFYQGDLVVGGGTIKDKLEA